MKPTSILNLFTDLISTIKPESLPLFSCLNQARAFLWVTLSMSAGWNNILPTTTLTIEALKITCIVLAHFIKMAIQIVNIDLSYVKKNPFLYTTIVLCKLPKWIGIAKSNSACTNLTIKG
jgi:hypothetical protein